jgi:hypothetical protein
MQTGMVNGDVFPEFWEMQTGTENADVLHEL